LRPVGPKRDAVRRYFDACREGDIETMAACLDEDATVTPSPYWAPPGAVYRGREGLYSLLEHVGTEPRELTYDIQIREAGNRILASGSSWRERAGGARDVRPVAWLFTVGRRGIERIDGYRDEAEALAALSRASDKERGEAFDAAPAPMLLLDESGLIVHVNRALTELLGFPEGQFAGRRIAEFGAPDSEGRTRDPESGGSGGEDWALIAADGSRRRVEFRASERYAPGRRVLVLLPRARGPRETHPAPVLTEREREIFRLLVSGLNGPEIASRLHISTHTVRTHVANGMASLQARTRAQAVAEALSRGELEI